MVRPTGSWPPSPRRPACSRTRGSGRSGDSHHRRVVTCRPTRRRAPVPLGHRDDAGPLAPGRGPDGVPDGDPLHRPDRAGLSRYRDRQLHRGHHQFVVGHHRRAGGPLGLLWAARHDGRHLALGLALVGEVARPGTAGSVGGGRGDGVLPGLHRAVPGGRHLPVVHRGPPDHHRPLRGHPGGPGITGVVRRPGGATAPDGPDGRVGRVGRVGRANGAGRTGGRGGVPLP